MSSFINLLSDGCVDFEKCGDVVVSVKDNIIGMFCHFCSDIFTSLSEFLHHLQWVHNDVLSFTEEHNVYTMEELMSLPDSPSNSSSSDSRVAADATSAISVTCVDGLNINIMNALAAYGVEYDELKGEIHKGKDSSNTLMKKQAEDPKTTAFKHYQEFKLQSTKQQNIKLPKGQLKHIKDKQHDLDSTIKTSTNSTDCKRNVFKDQYQAANSKHTKRIHEAATRIKSIKNIQPLCNLKSYAIARSARKREQQRRLGSIKKRIFRCLENDEIKLNCQSLREKHLYEHQKNKNKPLLDIEGGDKINAIKLQGQNNVIENIAESSKKAVDFPPNDVFTNSSMSNIVMKPTKSEKIFENSSTTNNTHKSLSPIIIQKIECLPKIDLKLEKRKLTKICSQEYVAENQQTEKPENEIKKRQHRSSLTVTSSPTIVVKRPASCPSYSAPNSGEAHMQPIKPEINNSLKQNSKRKHAPLSASIESVEEKQTKAEDNNRESLNFNLSESVVEFLQADLKSSHIDADSLLQLANPQIERDSVSEVVSDRDTPKKKFQNAASADPIYATARAKVRDDLVLLLLVGLPIIKDPNNEDRKPIEYSEALRSKALNFSKILKKHEIIWNPKRINGQFSHKIRQELAMLTKEINNDLMAKLNISELKRVLNLINAWYVEQMNQKFFKKVALSSAIEYYLLLFGFLPKINRCLYFCEWCEESSASKTRYEKHRMIHYGNFLCRHCMRGFMKPGYLINHIRIKHGKEN